MGVMASGLEGVMAGGRVCGHGPGRRYGALK